MDFTLKIYKQLLSALQKAGYEFITFEAYCEGKRPAKFVTMRHDVDLRAGHSLATAQAEADLGLKASYFFRVVPQSNQPDKIRAMAALGHEIGYHYEDLSLFKGDMEAATWLLTLKSIWKSRKSNPYMAVRDIRKHRQNRTLSPLDEKRDQTRCL